MIKKHGFGLFISAVIAIFLISVIALKDQSPAADYSRVADVDISSSMSAGAEDAPVSIVQYSDMLCPVCSYFSTQIMPFIQEDYIDTGIVKYEFRPMAFVSKESELAGSGAFCAADQDKFWTYHDSVYTAVATSIYLDGLNPLRDSILPSQTIKQIVSTTDIDLAKFESCLDDGRHIQSIKASTQDANDDGINESPVIFVNGEQFTGSMTFEALEALIKASQ